MCLPTEQHTVGFSQSSLIYLVGPLDCTLHDYVHGGESVSLSFLNCRYSRSLIIGYVHAAGLDAQLRFIFANIRFLCMVVHISVTIQGIFNKKKKEKEISDSCCLTELCLCLAQV